MLASLSTGFFCQNLNPSFAGNLGKLMLGNIFIQARLLAFFAIRCLGQSL